MAFVQAKCPNCGGFLAVDETHDAAVCQFCNTPFIVEKAINNYNITNNVNVGAGAVVNVLGSVNEDFEIQAGVLIKYNGKATDVVIPDSVKTINSDVFAGLPIESIVIPDTVSIIQANQFSECAQLKKVSFGNGVTEIGENAFSNCSSLETIEIGPSVEIIHKSAFSFCEMLKTVILGDKVTTIEDFAFFHCKNISKLVIGNSLKKIGLCVFNGNEKLDGITIPVGFSVPAHGMLSNFKTLKNVYVEEGNETYCAENGVLFNKDKTLLIHYCYGKTESSYTIPSSVKEIGNEAFWGATNLKEIDLNNVQIIGHSAFGGTCGLEKVTIPSSVSTVKDHAFSCEHLKQVIIENKSTTIEPYAFIRYWHRLGKCIKCGGEYKKHFGSTKCESCGSKREKFEDDASI